MSLVHSDSKLSDTASPSPKSAWRLSLSTGCLLRANGGRWKCQWQSKLVDLYRDVDVWFGSLSSCGWTSTIGRLSDVCPGGVLDDNVFPLIPDGQRGPGVCDWKKQVGKLCKRLSRCHVGSWSTMDLCSLMVTLCPTKQWPCLGLSIADGPIRGTHKCWHSFQHARSSRLQRNMALQESSSLGHLWWSWHNPVDDTLENVLGGLQMGTFRGCSLCYLLFAAGMAESSSDSTKKLLEMDHGLCGLHHLCLWKSLFLHQWTCSHWSPPPCLCHGLHDKDLQAQGSWVRDFGWRMGRESERSCVHRLHAPGRHVNAIPLLRARTFDRCPNSMACLCCLHPDDLG